MASDIRARQLRILIGPDQQDWSAHYKTFGVNYDSLNDESDQGLVKITADLTIGRTITPPESLNPRINPTRWRPGQTVYIQVRNDADDGWLDPWFSRLIITEEPEAPGLGDLQVRLGCKLTWADLFELDDERTGISYGTAEDSNLVASRLLQASEVLPSDISLNTWAYTSNRPIGKNTRSFAGQAGELAYSNNWRYLYQTPAGTITDRELTFDSTTAEISTVTIGTNDIIWEPLNDPQQPPELTKAAGIGYDLSDIANPNVSDDPVTGDFNDYDPSAFGTGTVKRTITTDSFNLGTPNSNPVVAPSKTNRVQTYELEVTIFQNPGLPTQLVEYTDKVIIKTYESGFTDPTRAKLIRIEETLLQRGKSIDPNDNFINMRLVYRKITTFTYGTNEAISRLQSTEEQAEILLDETSLNPWDLRVTREEDSTWAEYAPGRYEQVDVVGIARIAKDSNVDKATQNIWALVTTRTPKPTNNPNTPPTTEFFSVTNEAEQHYEGEASFIHPGGATGRNRQRLFTVPFGFSDAQMVLMASKHRDLLRGRHRGDEIELAINDALLTSPPLPRVDVSFNGDAFKYLGDALSFESTQTRATAHCLGIWLAGGYQETLVGGVTTPSQGFSGAISTLVNLSGGITAPNQTFSGALGSDDALNGGVTVPNQTFSGQLTTPGQLTGGFTMPSPTLTGSLLDGSALSWKNLTDSQWKNITPDQWKNMEN